MAVSIIRSDTTNYVTMNNEQLIERLQQQVKELAATRSELVGRALELRPAERVEMMAKASNMAKQLEELEAELYRLYATRKGSRMG